MSNPMPPKLRVALLTVYDWSNTGYRTAKCLRHLGYDVIALKGTTHKFNYPEQLDVHPALSSEGIISRYPIIVKSRELRKLVESVDVVHFIASTFVDTGADLSSKRVVVQHGGSTYRSAPEKSNAIFNPIVDFSAMQFQTLMGYGAKNEVLMYYPVDTDYIRPSYKANTRPIVVGHFPSDTRSKGTLDILGVCNRIKDEYGSGVEFNIDTSNVTWQGNLDRIKACDIVIETIKPVLTDKLGVDRPFGEWGNMALESAASGKVVITNCYNVDTYQREYNTPIELCVANDTSALYAQLDALLDSGVKHIIDKQHKTRAWVESTHSIEATAKRWHEKVYRHFE